MVYRGIREECVKNSLGHVCRADTVALPNARDNLQYLIRGCLQRHKNTAIPRFARERPVVTRDDNNYHNIFMWGTSKRGWAQIFTSHMQMVKQMLTLLQCLYRDSSQSLNTFPWRPPALDVTFSQNYGCSFWPPNTHICTHTDCLTFELTHCWYLTNYSTLKLCSS